MHDVVAEGAAAKRRSDDKIESSAGALAKVGIVRIRIIATNYLSCTAVLVLG